MTTVVIEDNSVQARHFIRYVRTLPFARVKTDEAEPEFNLYESLDRAFADVRLMMDGKKKGKSLDELIEELEKEQANEFCNRND